MWIILYVFFTVSFLFKRYRGLISVVFFASGFCSVRIWLRMCQWYFALLFLWKLAALGNKKACTVCQDLATDALTYLEKNKTREEIIIALHLHLQDLSKKVCRYSESSSSFKIPKYRFVFLTFHKSKRTCLQFSSVFLIINHFVSFSHLVAKQFILVLCIVVWIVLHARLLEVVLNECNRVTSHVEEVSSAILFLLPSICNSCKF